MQSLVAGPDIIATPGWFNNQKIIAMIMKQEVLQIIEQVKEYIDKYQSEIIDMYNNLRQLIYDRVSCEQEESL